MSNREEQVENLTGVIMAVNCDWTGPTQTGLRPVPLTIQEKKPDDLSLDTGSPSYGPNTAPLGMFGSTQRTSTSSPVVKTSRPEGTVSAALLGDPGATGVSGTNSGGP